MDGQIDSYPPASANPQIRQWWIAGGLMILVVVVAVIFYSGSRPDRQDVYGAAVNAASELRENPVSLTVTIFDVEDAIRAGNPPVRRGKFTTSIVSDLKVRSAGEDSRGDLYEISRDDGKYPVCLVVNVHTDLRDTDSSYVSASVVDGPC